MASSILFRRLTQGRAQNQAGTHARGNVTFIKPTLSQYPSPDVVTLQLIIHSLKRLTELVFSPFSLELICYWWRRATQATRFS